MSTKKSVRAEKAASVLREKTPNQARRIGLVMALAMALTGPVALVPAEEPLRSRSAAAWHPTADSKRKREQRSKRGLTVWNSPGALVRGPKANLYIQRHKGGAAEFRNRLKDRRRQLEHLMAELGIRVTHRQVKRILHGWLPPKLEQWLDSQQTANTP